MGVFPRKKRRLGRELLTHGSLRCVCYCWLWLGARQHSESVALNFEKESSSGPGNCKIFYPRIRWNETLPFLKNQFFFFLFFFCFLYFFSHATLCWLFHGTDSAFFHWSHQWGAPEKLHRPTKKKKWEESFKKIWKQNRARWRIVPKSGPDNRLS